MKHRGIELAVGTFVLAGLALIFAGILTIRGRGFGSVAHYDVLYRNISSVSASSPVKYSGYLVGRVEKVIIDKKDPGRIRVTLAITASTPVTDQMIAKITRSDLLGDEYIDLRLKEVKPGSVDSLAPHGHVLPDGSELEGGEPFDLQQAMEKLRGTVERTDDILARLQQGSQAAMDSLNRILAKGELLVSDRNVERVQQALDDLTETMADIRAITGGNRDRLDGMVADAAAVAGNLRSATTELNGSLQRLLPEMERVAADAHTAVDGLRDVAKTANSTVGAVDVQRLNDIMENLDVAGRNLTEFTREIKERPYLLIRKERPADPTPAKPAK